MASDQRRAALGHQEELLQQLVARFMGPTVGLVERQKAVGLCQRRLKFHSFLDTNPATVEERMSDVAAALRLESRQNDAERLQRLKSRFLNIPLSTDVTDFHHTVLNFLICMTGDLTSATHPVADHSMEIDSDHQSDQEMTDSEAWTDEDRQSPSELSAWSEADTEDDPPFMTNREMYRVEPLDWPAYFVPSQLTQMTTSQSHPKETQASLLVCLTKVQLPKVPLSACDLFLRTETDLVLGCLRVLQGRDSSVFRWDEMDQCYTVDPRLQSHHFSAVALRGILTWFSRYGRYSRSLMDWTSLIVEMGSRQNLSLSYGRLHPAHAHICPTLSATAQSLQENLNITLRPLIQLEHHTESHKSENVSIVQLKCLTGSIGRQIHALYQIATQLRRLDRREKTESEMMCETLDLLYDLAASGYLVGSPGFQPASELAWRVFVDSLTPLLAQLTAWLFLGDLSSIRDDFFVSPMPAPHTEESDFWMDAYPLREGTCPKFLLSVLSSIHDGGKALQFMRSQETGQQFEDYGKLGAVKTGRLETLIPDHWTRDLLNQKFQDYIHSTGQPLSATPPSQIDTVAQRMASAGNDRGNQAIQLLKRQDLPWTYIFEKELPMETPTVEQRPGSIPQESSHQETPSRSTSMAPTGAEDDSNALPVSFLKIQDAMKRCQAVLEAALDTKSTSTSGQALRTVLPNATERLPYAELREAIFQSAPQSSELPDRELQTVPRSNVHVHEAPAEVVLNGGLLTILHTRSVQIVRSFIDCLLHELGLMHEIMILKNVFLLGSPAMCEWTRRFSEQLILGHTPADLKEFQVITDMQECFLSCNAGEDLPVCGDDEFEQLFFDMRAAEWDPRFPESPLWSERSPQELDNCALIYPLKWPLCLVVNEPRLKRYNTVFLFLLKLQWVSYAVKSNGWLIRRLETVITTESLEPYPNLQDWRQLHMHCHEMNHFIKQLQQYVLQNVHAALDKFCQGIEEAQSVSELLNRHDQTLDEITRFSFQTRKKQWRTVHARVLTLFHGILNFCALCKSLERTDPSAIHERDQLLTAMNQVVGKYDEARSSAVMILSIYSHSLGGNGELSRLMTLLNFNAFYPEYDP